MPRLGRRRLSDAGELFNRVGGSTAVIEIAACIILGSIVNEDRRNEDDSQTEIG